MITHINTLAQYCETTWITRSHSRTAVHRPYVYCARKTPEEVEEARLRRALTRNLNTGLMPSMEHHVMAKGGSSGAFARDLFPVMGDGKVPQAPYTTTRRRLEPAHHMLATRDASMRHMPPSGQNGTALLHAEAPSHRICSAITTVPPLHTAQPATLPQMHPHTKGGQALLPSRPPVLRPQTHRAMLLSTHTRYTVGTKTAAATAACSPLPPGAKDPDLQPRALFAQGHGRASTKHA